ncbi:hypothetical protein T09_9825, partial [Trichinella sp. T9]
MAKEWHSYRYKTTNITLIGNWRVSSRCGRKKAKYVVICNKKVDLKILRLSESVGWTNLKSELTSITYVSVVKQLIQMLRQHKNFLCKMFRKLSIPAIR